MNILWKDRKRICGLPITFTKYSYDAERLFVETGLFTSHTRELLLYRVTDFDVVRTLANKIFGGGSIRITSSDPNHRELVVENIKHVMDVKEDLFRLVEEAKLRRRVRTSEFLGDNVEDPTCDDCHHEEERPF